MPDLSTKSSVLDFFDYLGYSLVDRPFPCSANLPHLFIINSNAYLLLCSHSSPCLSLLQPWLNSGCPSWSMREQAPPTSMIMLENSHSSMKLNILFLKDTSSVLESMISDTVARIGIPRGDVIGGYSLPLDCPAGAKVGKKLLTRILGIFFSTVKIRLSLCLPFLERISLLGFPYAWITCLDMEI